MHATIFLGTLDLVNESIKKNNTLDLGAKKILPMKRMLLNKFQSKKRLVQISKTL